jgi:hypothetical protein
MFPYVPAFSDSFSKFIHRFVYVLQVFNLGPDFSHMFSMNFGGISPVMFSSGGPQQLGRAAPFGELQTPRPGALCGRMGLSLRFLEFSQLFVHI